MFQWMGSIRVCNLYDCMMDLDACGWWLEDASHLIIIIGICFLLKKNLKPMIASYADPAHYSYIRCANFFNWYQSGRISDAIVISNSCYRMQKLVGRICLDDHIYFVYVCLTLFCRCLKIQSFCDSNLCQI